MKKQFLVVLALSMIAFSGYGYCDTSDTGNTDSGYTGGCNQWEREPNTGGCGQWGQNPTPTPGTTPGTTPTTTPTPISQPVDPVNVDDGYHQQRMQFINMSDGNYLAAETGASGAAVIAESDSSLRAQWVIHKAGGDYYQIINGHSGKILAPAGGTAVSGAALVAASNQSGSAQYWNLVAVQNDTNGRGLVYTIVSSANSGLAVTLQNGSYILSSNTKAAGQKFLFNAYGAEGFAGYSNSTNGSRTASITGGILGSVVSVSSVSQLQSYAKGTTPYTIVIDGNISASSITKVEVGQNKTFIGSYRNNALNNIHFRCISNSGNIIFKNITFNHSGNLNANDDIQVYISSGNKFWIDHCTFTGHSSLKSDDVDKFIYVGANNPPSNERADYVSVTACKFGGHKYGLILGYPQDTAAGRQFTGCPQMTIANCYFHSTITRAPGLMRYGYFHCYNNYVYDFSTAYTVYTLSNVYSENNYFDKGSHPGNIFDSSYAGNFTDSGSVLTNVNMNYSRTSWRPSSNYQYNVRAATQATAWCRNYAGSQSSTIVYSVDEFDNDSNGPIIGNNNGGQTGTVTNGTYSFVAVHSGKALDTWEWGTTDGTNIVQYDYWGGEAQQFYVSGDATWKEIAPIISMGQRLEVVNGSTNAGANIQTWSSNGYDAQKFKFESAASGAYRIINKGSGMCLTVQNASVEDGANVVQSSCASGANNQMFKVEAH